MNFNFLFSNKKSIYLFASLILGALFSLSFDPYNIPFFSIIIIGLFFKLNDSMFGVFGKNYSLMFLTGILFGFSFFVSSIYWITNSIFVFDSDLAYLSPFPLIVLPIILGIFYGLMQLFNIIFWNQNISRIFFFSISWSFFEIIRSTIFTGLPWNLIAYSWSWSIDFMQSLSIFGVFGLGILTVFCSAGIFSINIKKPNIILSIISILIIVILYLFGYNRVINYEDTYLNDKKFRIVSTNFNQKEKWSDEAFGEMILLGSDQIPTIFPETSFGMRQNYKEDWLIGFIRVDDKGFYNSVKYNNQIHDKSKLVPFGEFIPLHSFFNKIGLEKVLPMESFHEGKTNSNFDDFIVPLICYEGIFPYLVRENIQTSSGLLVNITNDAWFGTGTGPMQHFSHIRFRSVENGLPLIRSANMGISALINPIGQIKELIPLGNLDYVDVAIPQKVDQTLYAKFGDKISYFFIVLFFLIGYSTSKIFKD